MKAINVFCILFCILLFSAPSCHNPEVIDYTGQYQGIMTIFYEDYEEIEYDLQLTLYHNTSDQQVTGADYWANIESEGTGIVANDILDFSTVVINPIFNGTVEYQSQGEDTNGDLLIDAMNMGNVVLVFDDGQRYPGYFNVNRID